jgi:CHAT domain-containing protein
MRPNVIALWILFLPVAAALAGEPADDSPLIARTRSVLGEYAKIQTKDQGEDVRQRLLALADTLETADEDVWASQCLERAGILDYRFARYDQALQIWERGLAAARRSNDRKRIAALLNAQASGTSALGDNERAIQLCTELLTLRRELGDVRGEGITWHNKGFSHLALYEYPEAFEALRHAMRCHREADNGFGLAGSQLALVSLLAADGQRSAALAMADSAVAAAQRLEAPDMLAACLNAQAMELHHLGRVDESLDAFARSRQIAQTAGAVQVAYGSGVNLADALISAGRPRQALELLDDVGDSPMSTPANEAIALGIRGRALLASEDLDAAEAVLEKGVAAFTAMQDTLASSVSQADALQAGSAVTQLIRVFLRRGQPKRAWDQLEASAARSLRREITGRTDIADLKQVQAKLAELDAILLSYGNADIDGTVATLVTADEVVAFEISYPPSMPDDLTRLTQLVASGAPDESCAPILQRVSDAFLGPLEEHLRPGASRCVIVPGAFAGLAFESLPFHDASLGDAYAVSYSPSATVLLALESRAPASGGFLALADPSPAEVEGATTLAMRGRAVDDTPLPQARAEVRHIAPAHAVTYFGREANRQAFFEQAPTASVLHLATHAVIDPRHPGHSALILFTDDPDEPGVTAGEIAGLSLPADLVSLSGCQTAGGYGTGEGHFGLTRAFLVAGSRSVVSSWWDVEDDAARRFMELFYDGLGRGLARDGAAQQARRIMRDEGYPYRDRVAFAVTGAVSGAIPVLSGVGSGGRPRAWAGGAAIALVILGGLLLRRRRAASSA